MKELEFMELLSELPPEYIEAAAGPQKKRRTILRKVYGIPAIAACLVVIIAAAIYPRLRTVEPEQVPEPEQTTYTTTVAETVPYETEGTASAVTSLTDRDAAAEQTVTATQSSATARTAAGGTRDTEPAQTAASVRQTEQDHAAPEHSGANVRTTAGKTVPDKATTRTTVRTTAPARTTVKTTAPPKATTRAATRTTAAPKVTTRATARTTAAPMMTTRVTARTTAVPMMITRVTARTTAPMMTTRATARTTAPMMTTRATARTTAAPMITTRATARTTAVFARTTAATEMTAPALTTAVAGTTARDGSSGGGHWQPGSGGQAASPGDSSGSGWNPHGNDNDPDAQWPVPVFFLQTLETYEADDTLDGEAFFRIIEGGGNEILTGAFAGFAIPDGMDPAEYNVLRMDYYGYFADAVVTGAEYLGTGEIAPSICVLETGSTFRRFTALFWIPKNIDADAWFCSVNESVEWNADSFYSDLPDLGDVLMLERRY